VVVRIAERGPAHGHALDGRPPLGMTDAGELALHFFRVTSMISFLKNGDDGKNKMKKAGCF
jgi:hypothetical protein